MHTRHKMLALFLGLVMLSLAPLATAAAAHAAPPAAAFAGVSVPVTGTTSKGGKFTGIFTIQQFSVVNNQIVAVGTLTGTIQNSIGSVIGTVLKTIRLLVTVRGPRATSCTWSWGRSILIYSGCKYTWTRSCLTLTQTQAAGCSVRCSAPSPTCSTPAARSPT